MSADVFISYSTSDQQTAQSVWKFLTSKGISCWMAPDSILPGEEWGDSILRGIQHCKIMVLIFSQAANDSGPVRSEVDRAVNARKVLIPFRIQNVAPTGAMEFHIGRRHWLDAYTGRIERHFGLLERAVNDVLKPSEAKDPQAPPSAAGSESTLGQDTLSRQTDVASLLASLPQDDLPLRILLNFNQVVVAGHPSTFQMVVENKGKTALDEIEIVMESRGLERPVNRRLPRLNPAQNQRHLLEIEPVRSGNFVLQCTIKCHEEDRQIALVGSRTLRIDEADTAYVELQPRFEPLELSLDYNVEAGALIQEGAAKTQRLQIPAAFLNQAQAGLLLKLEPVETTANRRPDVRFVARETFSLGRSREETDFVAWFWPRSEVNDHKTRRISKKHCIFERKGAKIFLRDNGTSGHTLFDGQLLSAPEGEPFERRGILSLAGTYVIDVTPFPSNSPDGPVIVNLRNWSGAKAPAIPTLGGCVRFLPMSKQVLPQSSCWLLTDGAFGTSRANPVILESKGLAEIQGRFHFYLGGFWLENSVGNEAVSVNNFKLQPGYVIPLVTGQLVKLGDGVYRVTVQ
jgi:hypothetical protein